MENTWAGQCYRTTLFISWLSWPVAGDRDYTEFPLKNKYRCQGNSVILRRISVRLGLGFFFTPRLG